MSRFVKLIGGDGTRHEVFRHLMLRNWWEFYLLDDKEESDIRSAIVLGHEIEAGDISMKEIRPFIMHSTTELQGIMPPQGYEWAD